MTASERHKKWAAANRERLRQYRREWHVKNPGKRAEYNAKHYAYCPVKARAKALRRKYDISSLEFDGLLVAQNGRCAICNTNAPRGKGTWHVDHNHATGAVRGLLCQNCNIGLGNFGDDPLRLELAAKYLRESA